ASQLDRIKKMGIPLTVCVDKVAASGGYMMACVADQILAAPFAIIGSIGVVAQIPNIHRLLKRHDIDVELMTAGKYKRTLTVMGENTDEARDKFREDLNDIHLLFKEYVSERRQKIDIEQVATGETWYGTRAQQIGLIDDVKTSDEYLTTLAKDCKVFKIHYVQKKSLPEKLGIAAEQTSDRLISRWISRLLKPHYYS
ncbi:MAG: protease SohB, partial [Porticoccaceae bacterium]|nr:protease SohB [Porticoccaceae bacterium]